MNQLFSLRSFFLDPLLVRIPFSNYKSTTINAMNALCNLYHSLIELSRKRQKDKIQEKTLLDAMVAAYEEKELSLDELIDNLNLFFVAGHETVTHLCDITNTVSDIICTCFCTLLLCATSRNARNCSSRSTTSVKITTTFL